MKQLMPFIRKEFLHVLRDPKVLLILFGLPIVQVLLFGFVLSNEIKDTKIAVYDGDKTELSQKLIEKIANNTYFEVYEKLQSPSEFRASFGNGEVRMIVNIPEGFSNDFTNTTQKANIQLITDGTDINFANQINNYLANIISAFASEQSVPRGQGYRVVPEIRMLYNPQLKGASQFVPGVMAMILLIVCVMMTAVAIVREKENGTMEILLVSPLKPYYIIISKAVPYFVLSVLILTAILILSVTLLDLPINGSLFLLYIISIIYILTSLFLGILISTISKTQEQAMLLSLLGMLMPTLMLSGFMFSVENMPLPLQGMSKIVPASWYYVMIKNVMIKETGLTVIWKELLILSAMMVFFFIVAMKKFKIRLD